MATADPSVAALSTPCICVQCLRMWMIGCFSCLCGMFPEFDIQNSPVGSKIVRTAVCMIETCCLHRNEKRHTSICFIFSTKPDAACEDTATKAPAFEISGVLQHTAVVWRRRFFGCYVRRKPPRKRFFTKKQPAVDWTRAVPETCTTSSRSYSPNREHHLCSSVSFIESVKAPALESVAGKRFHFVGLVRKAGPSTVARCMHT